MSDISNTSNKGSEFEDESTYENSYSSTSKIIITSAISNRNTSETSSKEENLDSIQNASTLPIFNPSIQQNRVEQTSGKKNNNTYDIYKAAARGDLEFIQNASQLPDFDPNKKQEITERTPLLNAAAAGHVGIVLFLIEHGADINSQDRFGDTALHLAAMCDWLEVAYHLLKHPKIVTNILNKDGKTADQCARERKHLGVAKYIKNNSRNEDKCLVL